MFEILHDGNFLLFAAKFYQNQNCFDIVEFYEDLSRFKYIRRLLKKYRDAGELKEQLILNHIIILANLFGPEATARMLFLKLEGYEVFLKPFLVYLQFMPDKVENIGLPPRSFKSDEILMDAFIIEELHKL